MTRKPGRPSKKSPDGSRRRGVLIDGLVVLGIIASLGLIGVSALLNFRIGLRSADTRIDGLIYGSGAAMGEALKAMAPFMASWGWRNRDMLAIAAASIIFVVFTGYSLSAALGFAAHHRAAKAGEGRGAIERHDDLRKALNRVEQRLDALGPQRSVAELDMALANILQRPLGRGQTVGSISESCHLNRISTREACSSYASLNEDRARAAEFQTLTESSADLRTRLASNTKGIVPSADPQLDALTQAAGYLPIKLQRADLEFILAALLAMLIELGSGAGLYMVTTPWRQVERTQTAPPPRLPRARWRRFTPGNPDPSSSGMIERYILERLEPQPGASVPVAVLHADYQAWCRRLGRLANPGSDFEAELETVAYGVGLDLERGEGGSRLLRVAMASHKQLV